MKTICTSKLLASAVTATAVLGAGICSTANAESKTPSGNTSVIVGVGKSTSGPVAIAGAQTVTYDVTGIESVAAFGNASNFVDNLNLGANVRVIGIGWDVTLDALDPSWLSEMRVEFTDTGVTTGVGITPGVGDDAPGVASYDSGGILRLADFGLDFVVGADGMLRLEFWETFVDFPAPVLDGLWVTGTLTIEYVAGSAGCPADLTGDDVVDTSDLLQLLGAWGSCPGCPEDLTGDDVVDTSDLLQLLSAWGACPPGKNFGACCFEDGTCGVDMTEDDCNLAGGSYNGDFTSCDSCPEFNGETCASALLIDAGQTISYDTTGNDIASAPMCGGQTPNQPTGWFTVTGAGTNLTVNVDTDAGSAAAVYCGNCTTLLCVDGASGNSGGSNPFDAEVTWCAGDGDVYFIAVWRTDGGGAVDVTLTAGGACTPTVSCDPPDPNSCVGNCGAQAPGGCWCDEKCCGFTDCCADKFEVCGGCDPTPPACDGGDCPPGGTVENEPCGTDVNGGCNSTPPIFDTIALGETVCGNMWADGGTRDLDWHELVITEPTEVTFNGDAEFPVNMFITNGLCPTTIISPVGTGCTPTGTICLAPGTYHFVVGATGFEGFPCPGFSYSATVTGVPVAECAGGGDLSCVGNCGAQAPGGCWCDEKCCGFSDCCADKLAVCGGCDPGGGGGGDDSCVGNCGAQAPGGCWCDEKCCGFSDCCADKFAECGGCQP